MSQIAKRVQAQAQSQNIKENLRNLEIILESSDNTEDELVKFQDKLLEIPNFDPDTEVLNFGKKGTLLKKLRPSNIEDPEILRMEKELEEVLSDPKKKSKSYNFLKKVGPVTKFFTKVLSALGKITGSIRKLIFGCVNWICRNVFRMSNVKTIQWGGMFAGCVMITVMAIILAPLVAVAGAVLTGGAVISAVTTAVSTASSIGSIGKIISYITWLIFWYSTTEDTKRYITFAKFLDGIEEKSGKKLKLSYETRKLFTDLDRSHNLKMQAAPMGKDKEKIQAEKKRYYMFHQILRIYLDKHSTEKIGNDFPIFGKIIKGEKVTEKDEKDFKNWVEDYITGIDKIKSEYDEDVYKMALKSIHGYGYEELKVRKLSKSGKEHQEIADELGISIEEVENYLGKDNEQLKRFRKDAETIPESMFYYNTSNQKTADYLTSLIKNYGMEAKPIKGDKFKVGIYSGDKLLKTITNSMYEKRRKESIEEFKNTVLSVLKKRSESQNESFRFGKISKFRTYRY
jgi:hypothetical protein